MSHPTRRAPRGRAWTTAALPILTCAGLFAGGCAHRPPTGVKATGEPLVVQIRTESEPYLVQQKVGEVVSRTSSGNYVSTGIYESQAINIPVTYWQALQGKEKIDDQDFFRIGGDTRAAEEIAAMRDNAVVLNRLGLVILVLGGAATVGGFVLRETEKTTRYSSTAPAWTSAIAFGGLSAVIAGGAMALYGRGKMRVEHPIDDRERAKRVADKYNASLGVGAAARREPTKPPPTKSDDGE
jgi:hypothetical protein